MLRVALDVTEPWRARALHALAELATRWRVPVRVVAEPRDAHVFYSANATSCPDHAVFLPFDPALYDPRTVCEPAAIEDVGWTWRRAGRAEAGDLLGGVHRLLTFLDESHVADDRRDPRGTFRTDDLPEGRKRVLGEPLVERHAEALWRDIVRKQPALEASRVPRWPGGKRIALSPSHDVDATRLGSPAEIATNLAKAVLRRDPQRLHLAALGARHIASPAHDPYLAFGRWREWESARRLKSAFYVFHRAHGTPRDLNDCKSSLADGGVDWAALRTIADAGWEFGLHPSIHTKDTPGAFAACKSWLESRLERPVSGLRHHYWALDWRDPHRTLREHQKAGFEYDSSIAWRERPGFRAGTALPFHPYDPESGRALELLEIPCVLMDGHILLADPRGTRSNPEAALAAGRTIIERVRSCGGVLTTNWHQETALNRFHLEGYLEVLDELVRPLVTASDVWVATPAEVCRHWKRLAAELAPRDEAE